MRLTSEQLTLAYDDEPIIANMDLEIPHGKITALIGPNGCGKSTLLRGLSRLMKPRAGTVLLDGRSIHELPSKEVAQQVGILPQDPQSPDGLTVRDLVAQGRYPHQGWLKRWTDEDEAAVQRALRITTTHDLAERRLSTLSGGQRQRAWIAMALAQETDILLLDEPTTFLDLAHQMEVLDLLDELNERGRTIVMVLHDLNQACRYADHLVVMRDGEIYAAGDPDEIVTEQMLLHVFELACRIVADPVAGTPLCVPIGCARRVKNLSAVA